MSRKVTMRDSMTNRPTCGGPRKAGLAPRGTNFMMGVKTNHVFRGTPFAGKAADYPMSCRGGGSSGGGNGLTLGGGLLGSVGEWDFCKKWAVAYYEDPEDQNYWKSACEELLNNICPGQVEDGISDSIGHCMRGLDWQYDLDDFCKKWTDKSFSNLKNRENKMSMCGAVEVYCRGQVEANTGKWDSIGHCMKDYSYLQYDDYVNTV